MIASLSLLSIAAVALFIAYRIEKSAANTEKLKQSKEALRAIHKANRARHDVAFGGLPIDDKYNRDRKL